MAEPVPFKSAVGELMRLRVFWAAVIVAIASVAMMLSFGRGTAVDADSLPAVDPASLPVHGKLPPFSFTDQTGAVYGDAQMRGRVAIVSFIFTRCPTVCPVVSMKMKNLAEVTAGEPGIQLVSFSVDPAYDTPPVLAEFAAKFGADPARWRFLTGEPALIRSAVEGSLKIAMDAQGVLDNGAPDIVHGTHLVLLDAQLRIRGYYDYSDERRIAELVRDATALARQGSR